MVYPFLCSQLLIPVKPMAVAIKLASQGGPTPKAQPLSPSSNHGPASSNLWLRNHPSLKASLFCMLPADTTFQLTPISRRSPTFESVFLSGRRTLQNCDSMLPTVTKTAFKSSELVGITGKRYRLMELLRERPHMGCVWTAI